MTPREILRRYHQAMLDASADDLADLYAPGAVHEFPFLAPGFPERFSGPDEVRAGYRAAWANPSTRLTAIRDVAVYEPGDGVVVSEWTGDVTSGGRSFTLSGVLAITVRDGRIVHVRDYMDALGLAHRTGRLPAVVALLTGA